MTALLATEALTCRFAGLTAVDRVDLSVEAGSIHALIGPNGAGKTTLFNLISGLQAPSEGSVRFAGQAIDGLPVWRRSALGISRTFQNLRLFAEMTVLETVLAGAHLRLHASLLAILLRRASVAREEAEAVLRARAVLDRVGLIGQDDRRAGDLSHGDRRRLEIARALAASPKLLLLDEPAAGLNPAETASLAELLRGLPMEGVTLLLVEHDMSFVMGLSDRLTVLNFGRVIKRGTPAEIRADPHVIEAYLGRSDTSEPA